MVYIHLIIAILFSFTAHAADSSSTPKKTVCLNMIVKNESKVIERCLTSVLPIIDYWVIVDTGSSDGTQQVIKDFMSDKGVPGEVHERPWVNFAHNRNEALDLARTKADYVLFIDADEYFQYEAGFQLPHPLDKDFYYVTFEHSGTKYNKSQMIKASLDWKWVGVLHEVVCSSQAKTYGTLDRVLNIYTQDGARSRDPQKYQKDAQVLEAALKDEPNNSRYVFYLAQSYRDAGEYAKSLQNYEKRIAMGGWDQEVFWSMLQAAQLQQTLQMAPEIVIQSYLRAYNYRPSRAEPLYFLANYYRSIGNFAAGYVVGSIGSAIPMSDDILFVEHWIYDYGLPLEASISAYWIGKYEECRKVCAAILKKNNLPQNVRECVEKNLDFANTKLSEITLKKPPAMATSNAHR